MLSTGTFFYPLVVVAGNDFGEVLAPYQNLFQKTAFYFLLFLAAGFILNFFVMAKFLLNKEWGRSLQTLLLQTLIILSLIVGYFLPTFL